MSTSTVKRAYKYRFYPTDEQAQQLAQTFGCVRYVYNRALDVRSRAWVKEQKRINYYDTGKMLTSWKREEETSWLSEPARGPLQESLRNLQLAFDRFWRKKAKYPNFKRKGKSKDSATYYSNYFAYRGGQIKLSKHREPLAIRWSKELPEGAAPSQVTVSRDRSGRYFISILIEENIEYLPASEKQVGLDAGITSLYTLSTGEKISNPRYGEKDQLRLAKAQKALSRKQKGSSNRAKARLKVARVYSRISDRRQDHLNKLSTRLIRENQTVVIEDLSVRNMVKNRRLSRSISDASWSKFRHMLEYKAEWYGRELIAVDRFYPSSKTCSACGSVVQSLPLSVRSWTCGSCGAEHDRDVNAALNILAVGLAVSACGDGIRPNRP